MSRSNPWKRKPHFTRHTTLIVVEGDTEYAFVKYLQQLCGRGVGTRVTIENAHGGSGDEVLRLAIRRSDPFDVCACLYDEDRAPVLKKLIREAERLKIRCLVSRPAIEGVLLQLSGKKVPSRTDQCKALLKRLYPEDSFTDKGMFEKNFPEARLLGEVKSVAILAELLMLLRGSAK